MEAGIGVVGNIAGAGNASDETGSVLIPSSLAQPATMLEPCR